MGLFLSSLVLACWINEMSSMPSASMSRVRSVFLSLSGGAGTLLFVRFSLGGSSGVNGGWISCSGGGASPSLSVPGCPSWPSLLCSGVGVLVSLSSSPGLFGWSSWLLLSCSDSMMMAGP